MCNDCKPEPGVHDAIPGGAPQPEGGVCQVRDMAVGDEIFVGQRWFEVTEMQPYRDCDGRLHILVVAKIAPWSMYRSYQPDDLIMARVPK